MSYDPHERARETYELAYERVLLARTAWEAAGKPFVHTFRNGMVGQSPHLRALREAEQDAAKFLALARVKHRGPSPRAVVQTDIGTSPAEKLRLLKTPPAGA